MPRVASDTAALVADLKSRLDQLVATAVAEGRIEALANLRSVLAGGAPVRRGPGRPKGSKNKPRSVAAKPKRRRKNSWAGLSPAARLARVNAIRKGKGLPPKVA
jgi:hypothetical protein